MNDNQTLRRSRQRGYSLIEILVAMTIFTTVVLAALLLYDRSNKVFKQSMEAGDMQQSTRVAFDKLVADLRMTGFDYDRDGTPFSSLATVWTKETSYTKGMTVQPTDANGHTYVCVTSGKSGATEPTWKTGSGEEVTDGTVLWQEDGTLQFQQPDEQIEYAGEHAIAIRGNFNFETAIGPCAALTPCENGREPALQSAEFPVVTVANNEIIAYALKPVKWATGESADELVFYADVDIPRDVHPGTDQVEDEIVIGGVDLCDKGCNSPPYTLYRFTIGDDGDPDAGTPIAENIRNLSFRYFNTTTATAAAELAEYPNGDGAYNGKTPDAKVDQRNARASIRALELALIGMNPQEDPDFTDPDDAVAPHYRKLELKSLVVPRNIGRRGMREYNTEQPEPAEIQSYCSGACNAVFLTWTAPATGGDIDSFAILYDTDPCTVSGGVSASPAEGYQYSEEVGLNLSGSVGRFIEPGKNWYFAVQSINKFGAATSDCVGPVLVQNTTKPAALTVLHATGGGETDYPKQKNQISLYFPAAEKNVSGQDQLSCDTGPFTQTDMPPAENRYYEIVRGTSEMFDPDALGGTTVRVLDAGTATQPTVDGTLLKWNDTTAANCKDYWYRIRVVDYCARNAAWNNPANTGQATSDWYPVKTSKAIKGYAENITGGVKPLAPTLTLSNSVCSGASGNCTLTFTWGAINKNTANETIFVDKYILQVSQKVSGTYGAPIAYPVTGGALTTTHDVSQTGEYKFTLVAEDCATSDASNELVYPCTYTGGTITPSIPTEQVFGGTGTAADPYIVEGPTLSVTTQNSVKNIAVSVFNVSDGTQVGTTQTTPGTSTTSGSFALPQTPDGRVARVLITATDSAGCTKSTDFYILDQPAGSCSVTDMGSDTSLLTIDKTFVSMLLHNAGSSTITLKQVVLKYDTGEIPKGLDSVNFNGTDVTAECEKGTVIITAPASQTVASGTKSYKLTFNFDIGNMQGNNPISSVCLVYQTPTGDQLSCQIFPLADTCTVPTGAACQ